MRREDYLRAEVHDVRVVSPNLLRIWFGGDELRGFIATQHADQRILIAFPAPGENGPTPPVLLDGCHGYPDEATRPATRSYTVRGWDPGVPELVVDFALHGGGVADGWARRAAAGAVVYVSADIGWYRPPEDTSWWLLAADLAGLPALARIAEGLPAGGRAHAVVEVADGADVQPLPSPADVSIEWLTGTGNGVSPSALPDAVRGFALPPGPGYVWSATEAAAAREIRKHARRVWQLPAARFDIDGYWRAGQEAWLARYRAVQAELEAAWTGALRDGKSEDDAVEILDEAMEQAGL